ncbi:MAG: Lrp/AsnC family transcriptional regulator [archaeon]
MNSEIVLDMKDKRILRELFRNGRMAFSIVGKKIGLSKEVVHYRVNNLIKKGLLIGFNTIYDIKKIGWKIYLVYVKLKNVDNEKENQIINELSNHPNVAWVIKCIGNYDLVLKFFVKDNFELNSQLKELEKKFSYFDDFSIDFVDNELPIPVAYLYSPLKPYLLTLRNEDKIDMTKIDILILELLSKNSRMQLSDISLRLKIPRDTIKYHLNKLEKSKVIITYRPSAWSGSKSMGYSWYLVLLRYKQIEKHTKSTLLSYLTTNLNIAYVYELIGQNDLGFEIRLKTGDELNQILMEIRAILGPDFKSHDLSLILKEYKYTYFTDCMKKR